MGVLCQPSGRIHMKRRPSIILGLLCLPAVAAPTNGSGPPADIFAVRNIEMIFQTFRSEPERRW